MDSLNEKLYFYPWNKERGKKPTGSQPLVIEIFIANFNKNVTQKPGLIISPR